MNKLPCPKAYSYFWIKWHRTVFLPPRCGDFRVHIVLCRAWHRSYSVPVSLFVVINCSRKFLLSRSCEIIQPIIIFDSWSSLTWFLIAVQKAGDFEIIFITNTSLLLLDIDRRIQHANWIDSFSVRFDFSLINRLLSSTTCLSQSLFRQCLQIVPMTSSC